MAILSLHSDQTACGHQLISHCRSLSRKLTNPEVDACLLTDIMKQLLFSAKLMFVKVGRSQDLALCDRSVTPAVDFHGVLLLLCIHTVRANSVTLAEVGKVCKLH